MVCYITSVGQTWIVMLESLPMKLMTESFSNNVRHICRKTAASYRELEARKNRVQELEKIYMDMSMQKELQVSIKFKRTLIV